MSRIRVACFIDGFNLYHSIRDLNKPHLKWLNLWKLTEVFLDRNIHDLTAVYYFSAYADWLREPLERHKQYVSALKSVNVTPVMGQFKEKSRKCPECGYRWTGHEEKETDVNTALWLLNEARKNTYDQAFLMSGDSDLAPAVRMLICEHPEKTVKVVAMVNRYHSKELAKSGTKLGKIKEIHLERSSLPQKIYDDEGNLITERPSRYDPPSRLRNM